MLRTIGVSGALIAIIFVLSARSVDLKSPNSTVPVVVELFTSEGCSSCPPADKLLTELDHQPIQGAEIIALGIHVDYWNKLGWVDRFSSKDFTHRQNDYGRRFGLDSVYTPQMIVDGRYQFVGNDEANARKVIAAEAKQSRVANVALKLIDDHTLDLHVDNAGGGSPDVLLAISENGLSTTVRAGENNGRELRHSEVVRELVRLGSAQAGHFEKQVNILLKKEWDRANLRAVAIVQTAGTGEIVGAAAIPLK